MKKKRKCSANEKLDAVIIPTKYKRCSIYINIKIKILKRAGGTFADLCSSVIISCFYNCVNVYAYMCMYTNI